LIVFGRRAGRFAAEYAQKVTSQPAISDAEIKDAIAELEAPFNRTGPNPYEVQKEMHKIMSEHVGIFREEKELQAGIEKIHALKKQIKEVSIRGTKLYNPGWHLCRDLQNMIVACEAIAISALSRKESRGAHSRLDYEKTDPALGKENTSVSKDKDGSMKLEKTPLPTMPDDLKGFFVNKEPAHAG
jgi:succinate dehydrogenase / fumarate reductase, flavoprotein subunit